MQDVLTAEEVAAYLRVPAEDIYRLISENALAAARVGDTYRIPREDVEAFLLAHSNRPEVKRALFDRVLSVADRNPGADSDDILRELEADDRARRQGGVTR
jgi:excisionase family DNA binding protein